MILKSHLCGVAVVYDEGFTKTDEPKNNFFADPNGYTGRVQGSLYSQQKRKIADACSWLIKNATYKPLIFTATSPGFTDLASEKSLISKLTHNLRNGYHVKNYLWVREFTEAGYPHFHFVADSDYIDGKSLSLYWSRLFNCEALNSIRLGTSPRCNKCKAPNKRAGNKCWVKGCNGTATVKYYLDNDVMAWYMSKYIGKGIGGLEKMALDHVKRNSFRTFHVSRDLAEASAPTIYKSDYVHLGKTLQAFTMRGNEEIKVNERIWNHQSGNLTDTDLHKNWKWEYTGFSSTYKGYPKRWKRKK